MSCLNGNTWKMPTPGPVIEQPPHVEIVTVDEIFIKQIHLAKAGSIVPQHSHAYDHTTALLAGSIRVWQDGKYIGDYLAPQMIVIGKGTKHTFLSLEDNTTLYCLHNLSRGDTVKVLEEHQLDTKPVED